MKKAEFGSVAFFRRMIAGATLLVILLLIALLLITRGQQKAQLQEFENYKSEMAKLMATSASQEAGKESFQYQLLYPDLYIEKPEEYTRVYDDQRFFYLTFNEGPSNRSEDILKVLSEKKVKATFFVRAAEDQGTKDLIRRISEEGHTVGVYMSSDKPLAELYDSVESYLEDFEKSFNTIKEATGKPPEVFRFAGGTTNKYSVLIRKELTAEMLRRGFSYYDWNATGGDYIAGVTSAQVFQNTVETAGSKQRIFLELTDSKEKTYTVEALPDIIDHFTNEGYEFQAISKDTRPMSFD